MLLVVSGLHRPRNVDRGQHDKDKGLQYGYKDKTGNIIYLDQITDIINKFPGVKADYNFVILTVQGKQYPNTIAYSVMDGEGKPIAVYDVVGVEWMVENLTPEQRQTAFKWLIDNVVYMKFAPAEQAKLQKDLIEQFSLLPEKFPFPNEVGITRPMPDNTPPFTKVTLFKAFNLIKSISKIPGDTSLGSPLAQSIELADLTLRSPAEEFIWTAKEAAIIQGGYLLTPKLIGQRNMEASLIRERYSYSWAILLYDFYIKHRPGSVPNVISTMVGWVNNDSFPGLTTH